MAVAILLWSVYGLVVGLFNVSVVTLSFLLLCVFV